MIELRNYDSGKYQRIEIEFCTRNGAIVILKGAKRIVPYSAIRWISDDWYFKGKK
jgi:hypothetical protein